MLVVVVCRYLVDRGCVLVGHGLKKDFRIMNVFVAPSQVTKLSVLIHLINDYMIVAVRRKSSLVCLCSALSFPGNTDRIYLCHLSCV